MNQPNWTDITVAISAAVATFFALDEILNKKYLHQELLGQDQHDSITYFNLRVTNKRKILWLFPLNKLATGVNVRALKILRNKKNAIVSPSMDRWSYNGDIYEQVRDAPLMARWSYDGDIYEGEKLITKRGETYESRLRPITDFEVSNFGIGENSTFKLFVYLDDKAMPEYKLLDCDSIILELQAIGENAFSEAIWIQIKYNRETKRFESNKINAPKIHIRKSKRPKTDDSSEAS